VVQGRAALRSILELERREVEVEEDHKDTNQDQDPEVPSGGPDHEIADDADAHLAERLIELLTYVTASCKRFWLFPSNVFFSIVFPRAVVLLCPRRAFHATSAQKKNKN